MKNITEKAVLLFLSIIFIDSIFCFGFSEKLLNYKIEEIKIAGNKAFADRVIESVMLSGDSPLFSKPVFYENLLRDDLESIKQLYFNNGYLEAQVASEITVIDSVKKLVSIRLTIEEGEPTIIDKISFTGNNHFPGSLLRSLLYQKEKQIFNESLLQRDNLSLLSFYARHGHIDAVVQPELALDNENHHMSILYRINEGVKVRIDSIRMKGLEKTQPVVLQRELSFQAGSVFNYVEILNSQQRLLKTGLFKSVAFVPVLNDSAQPQIRNVFIEVEEKETGELNFGIGFGSYERLRGSMEFFQNNFRGMANQIGARLRLSEKLQRVEFSFTNPWFFFERMKFDLNMFREHRIEPNYELDATGGRLTVGKKISQNWILELGYKLDDVDYLNIEDDMEMREQNRGKISRLRFRINRETRDDLVNTTTGSFMEQKVEFAGGFLKGAHSFVKLTSENRFFRKMSPDSRVVIGARIHFGWMDQFGESLIIPLNERFYAGGDGSIRGFSRRSVGPKRGGDLPVGGNFTLITNYELRFPLYKKLGATLFWDAGNVWQNPARFRVDDIRHGTGCGLRYNSSLGIARLDFGVNMHRKNGEKPGEVYFTIGQIF